MKTSRLQGKRRIFVGLTLAVVVSGVWLWWSRRVTEPLSRNAPRGATPFVQVAGANPASVDRLLQERADYFDPTPLFIPTARNYYGGRGLPSSLVKQPGQVFGDFGAKYQFGEGGLAAYGAEATAVPDSVPEVLNRANEAPFAGMGEQGGGREALPEREAWMEFKQLTDGELKLAEAPDQAPPRHDFSPLEFLVLVSPSGLIGDPVLTAGSGRPEVDAFFQDYLAKSHRVGMRLAPGRYRVRIGP